MLTTLFFAQGVPMLLAGDELYRTQNGNNNAYCQDNEISWVNWDGLKDDDSLLQFVRGLVGAAPRASRAAPRHLSQGRAARQPCARHFLVACRRTRDGRPGVEQSGSAHLAVGLGGTASSPDLMLLLNPTEAECEFAAVLSGAARLGSGARHRASGRRVVGIPAARRAR